MRARGEAGCPSHDVALADSLQPVSIVSGVCTSMEGLHFTIWSDRPLVSTRRWTRYVPLYYDVEPTCEDRDFADP